MSNTIDIYELLDLIAAMPVTTVFTPVDEFHTSGQQLINKADLMAKITKVKLS